MRPLTEEETKTLFQKLAEYMGRSVERLINRSDERHCFRLIKVRQLQRKNKYFDHAQINGFMKNSCDFSRHKPQLVYSTNNRHYITDGFSNSFFTVTGSGILRQ